MLRNALLPAAVAAIWTTTATALEVDPNVIPEISLGGRVIVTPAHEREDGPEGDEDDTVVEFDDSSILFGFSKYLFDDENYGFGVFGLKIPEDDTDLDDDIFIHEAHVGVGGPRFEVKLGRSRLTNTLVQFPTLRDDDLLEFTHVLNGHTNTGAEEDQIFGGIVQGSWWFTDAIYVTGAVTARTESDAAGDRGSRTDFNGASLGVAYSVPESIKFDRGLRFAGIGVDYQDLEDFADGFTAPGDETVAVIAGLTYNLSDNPEATWVVDGQGIHNDGAEVEGLGEPAQRARAESTAAVAALRYFHRPYLQTRWQAAVTVGWKDYHDFADAGAYTVAPTFVYRLGSGVDFLAQYRYRHNDDGLAAFTGVEDEHVVAAGLSFSFDHTFNETVGDRGAILNLEHGTLDIGPIGGGH
ncbi:MAG: hypothetical protein M3Z21_06565 [Pseudomonadota bacterium]|nr:hypothetical protein [Pseudomonadota bacterium]